MYDKLSRGRECVREKESPDCLKINQSGLEKLEDVRAPARAIIKARNAALN